MFKLGLTGGIGSGKTAVSDRLAHCGAAVIDSDVMAHRVTAVGGTAITPIAERFGRDYITAEGALDRAKMRERVFNEPAARARLEAITHPLIRAETEKALATPEVQAAPYVVFAIPLLTEAGASAQARVDRILVVDCAPETQITRVVARSGLSVARVESIIAAQADRAQRLAIADDVIVNDQRSLADLYAEVDRLDAQYRRMAQAKTP